MNHWGYYLRGWLLENLGRRELAVDAYRLALRARQDFARARNRLAYTLAQLERFGEAEPHFRAVLQAEPQNALAHFNLGFTLDKRGLHAESAEAFRNATRLGPKIDRA